MTDTKFETASTNTSVFVDRHADGTTRTSTFVDVHVNPMRPEPSGIKDQYTGTEFKRLSDDTVVLTAHRTVRYSTDDVKVTSVDIFMDSADLFDLYLEIRAKFE